MLNNDMKVIGFVNHKGGSGKSTLCQNMAVRFAKRKFKVCLKDHDTELGSLSSWFQLRPTEDIEKLRNSGVDELGKEISEMRAEGNDFFLCDTPPNVKDKLVESILLNLDLAIVPVKATQKDVSAAEITLQRLVDLGVPYLVVINQVIPNSNVPYEIYEQIKASKVPVATTFIYNRIIYSRADMLGLAPEELEPCSDAACETERLWDEIVKVLKKQSRKAA